MTIDKAIATLHEDLGANTYDTHPYLYQAQKLAIQALKAYKHFRACGLQGILPNLPDETEV